MADRETVIKGLEQCKEGRKSCEGCPYDIKSAKCLFLLHADALALLKEQEDKIKQLRLALQILSGNGIEVDTEGR